MTEEPQDTRDSFAGHGMVDLLIYLPGILCSRKVDFGLSTSAP